MYGNKSQLTLLSCYCNKYSYNTSVDHNWWHIIKQYSNNLYLKGNKREREREKKNEGGWENKRIRLFKKKKKKQKRNCLHVYINKYINFWYVSTYQIWMKNLQINKSLMK